MATEELNFWYDAQIRRMMGQVVRIFSNLKYASDYKSDGSYTLKRIPARMAMTNRQVAHILKNNSENVMLSVPSISINLENVTYDRNRVQEPFHIDKVQIYERNWDKDTGEYGPDLGGTYTLERIMAVPVTLEIKVDFWVSNQQQKEQIFEQLIVLFNPSLQIQSSDNVFDWTALTEIELDGIQWSSRGVPIGTNDEIEVMSISFKLPTWISAPAILQRQKLINTIITNILETNAVTKDLMGSGYGVEWSDSELLARQIVTPGNHAISIEGNTITLLSEANGIYGPNNTIFPWAPLLEQYGVFRPGISMISLNPTNEIENFTQNIKGIVDWGSEPNQLIFNIDPMTLPVNTLPKITAIINPHEVYPGHGIAVPSPGTRYLLLEDIGDSVAWGVISARVNDIIEWDGSKWNTIFVAQNEKNKLHYVLNDYTKKQLKWSGSNWSFAIEGIYARGYWRILL